MALKKLMDKYCERFNLNLDHVKFIYEGDKVNPYNTPSELNINSMDEITVVIEQVGGGVF